MTDTKLKITIHVSHVSSILTQHFDNPGRWADFIHEE